jgi:hypothetical protein
MARSQAFRSVSALSAWKVIAILGFALIAPVTLPAGGAERRPIELRRRQSLQDPWLLSEGGVLQCAPRSVAPALVAVQPGQPLRVMRGWLSPTGRHWLHVESASSPMTGPIRGWLAVS